MRFNFPYTLNAAASGGTIDERNLTPNSWNAFRPFFALIGPKDSRYCISQDITRGRVFLTFFLINPARYILSFSAARYHEWIFAIILFYINTIIDPRYSNLNQKYSSNTPTHRSIVFPTLFNVNPLMEEEPFTTYKPRSLRREIPKVAILSAIKRLSNTLRRLIFACLL